MMNNKMLKLWKELDEERAIGLVKRLYSSDLSFRIYATYRYPEAISGVAFNFNNDVRINISNFENLKDIKVSLFDDVSFDNSKLLLVELLHPESIDVFSTLCENLIYSVKELESEKDIAQVVINQLSKWKKLFEKSNTDGLTNEQQQGLYGELTFLQKCLLQQNTYSNVLDTWVGVNAALRDFQASTWAVEVKTTATNNPQKISISGERQLDESLLDNLFLFHCSVEVSNGNGETLSQKVAAIRSLLENDYPARNKFDAKLLDVGYFDNQAYKYDHRFYKIRSENYYRVADDFPRIKEQELRDGVCGVKYDIVLAMCNEYLITEKQLLTIIQNND